METDYSQSVNIDTRKQATGNYISNQEVLDQWLEGVRPESSLSIQ